MSPVIAFVSLMSAPSQSSAIVVLHAPEWTCTVRSLSAVDTVRVCEQTSKGKVSK